MIFLNSWNKYAIRFIDAPVFSWGSIKWVKEYEIMVASGMKPAISFKVTKPEFAFAEIWNSLECGTIQWCIKALDDESKMIDYGGTFSFSKSPDFDGKKQDPLDYRNCTQKIIKFLTSYEHPDNYDPSLPAYIWHCAEINGKPYHASYPGLNYTGIINAFLRYARRTDNAIQRDDLLKRAIQLGDWLLENRLPENYALPLLPYSTISKGEFSGGCEGKSITLFRSALLGRAIIHLFNSTKQEKYLEYARHIAGVLQKHQRPDGSWPYRVNPETGEVVAEYTSAAIFPVLLFEELDNLTGGSEYLQSREKAVQWILENPVKTHLWQGMFEDIPNMKPFKNLEPCDAIATARYLIKHQEENADYLKIAQRLNRWIEDQFVVFGPEPALPYQPYYPSILEQYACYWAMDFHTGEWVLLLRDLYKATGKLEYLHKAIAGANTMVRFQQEDGRMATFGVDHRFDIPQANHHGDAYECWFGCTAESAVYLMEWSDDFQEISKQERKTTEY